MLEIGSGKDCFIIAEISGNHAGKLENAIELIREAALCGANAVKFQAYTADSITLNSPSNDFKIPKGNSWESFSTLHQLYQTAQTPFEWIPELFKAAQRFEIPIFASVFDFESVQILEKFAPFAYKVASPEASDFPLLKILGETKRPVFISTGLSTAAEIYESDRYLKKYGCPEVIWLKANTAYPAPLLDVNLRTINHLKGLTESAVGFSDHTIGTEIPIAAVALGADVIEKHLKLSDVAESVDDFFSLTPLEFASMVSSIRNVEKALGKISYDIPKSSLENMNGKRSLYCINTIKEGEVFTLQNVRSIRPSYGLPTQYFEKLLGSKSKRNLKIGDRIILADIDFKDSDE